MVTENSFLIPKDTVADNTAASVDVQKFTWSKLQKVISKLGCETETQESLIFEDKDAFIELLSYKTRVKGQAT